MSWKHRAEINVSGILQTDTDSYVDSKSPTSSIATKSSVENGIGLGQGEFGYLISIFSNPGMNAVAVALLLENWKVN